MRFGQLFTNRWMALVFAAGVALMAVSVSGTGPSASATDNSQSMTDVTGAPVSNDQVKQIESIVNDI